MNTRTRAFRSGTAAALLLAFVCIPWATAQQQTGEVTAYHKEAMILVIGQREYQLTAATEINYGSAPAEPTAGPGGEPQGTPLRPLAPGVQVRYKSRSRGEGQRPEITELTVLE